jgi:hypothetical protein
MKRLARDHEKREEDEEGMRKCCLVSVTCQRQTSTWTSTGLNDITFRVYGPENSLSKFVDLSDILLQVDDHYYKLDL